MGNIQKIKDYEKIAAGEVIDRPASVVKELLENSIDAGASRIEIHVEAAGTKSIKVIDNGSGIEPDEVILAFDRHTTSRIHEFEDIYNLSTLGFRGEALASIKAVSRTEIATRTVDHELGKKVVLEEDRVLEDSEIACPVGTTVVVKKLFYNVPVRKKFLKNDSVEFSHISDIVTRYALASHDIDIKLFHDGRLVIDAPASKGDLLNKIVAIYGKDHASNMLEMNETAPDFSLHGYIATPEITRSSRGYSSIFVNSRYIYSPEVAKAIENAYEARLMKGRYPFYVLFLDIKPALIDVNIHPTKKEIKFSNEDDVLHAIEEWVRAKLDEKVKRPRVGTSETSLEQHAVKPNIARALPDAGDASQQGNAFLGKKGATTTRERQSRTKNFDDLLQEASDRVPENLLDVDDEFNRELENDGEAGAAEPASALVPASPARLSGWKPLAVAASDASLENVDSGTFKVLPPLKLLTKGVQLGNMYLFFVSADGDLVIVDQHAASERVEYEKIMKKYEATGITSQEMLIPKTLSLLPSLLAVLDANMEALNRLGFEIGKDTDDAGVECYKVTRFPFVFHVNIDFQVIEDFLEAVLSSGQIGMEDDILKLMACHAAIRAGEALDKKQIWTLLSELDKCDDPYHCCHGRPTFITKPVTWLDKEFKRIV
ncbi:MAG TPA: DNA mismatch repair endonuclease MutL [Candidatus Lokiarchaeia archaeon]|nr:DNA mismatch repair endonuclease MutL [Candidatus Lokiarchaeia archaeon]